MEQFVLSHGVVDLFLILLGFGAGFATQLRTPIALTIFMIRILKWWFETHPHGKEVAEKTDLDEYFNRVFSIHLKEHDNEIPAEPQEVDNTEKGSL